MISRQDSLNVCALRNALDEGINLPVIASLFLKTKHLLDKPEWYNMYMTLCKVQYVIEPTRVNLIYLLGALENLIEAQLRSPCADDDFTKYLNNKLANYSNTLNHLKEE